MSICQKKEQQLHLVFLGYLSVRQKHGGDPGGQQSVPEQDTDVLTAPPVSLACGELNMEDNLHQ